MFGLLSALLLSEATAAAASTPNNQIPGLIPPAGGWRGSTLGAVRSVANYTSEYGVPLHIYRSFHSMNKINLTDEERDFIHSGGIVFYSFQPKKWAQWADVSNTDTADAIDAIAAAVSSVAPAKVMVCPGFLPNRHVGDPKFGKASEFVAMRRRFAARFSASNVTNVIWAMEYQRSMYKDWYHVQKTWPGNDIVDWLMWNAFGEHEKPTIPQGNFTLLMDEMYEGLLRKPCDEFGFDKVPWGISAYGPKAGLMTPPARNAFMQDVSAALDASRYPRLKALIYFDSQKCIVTPDLEETYKAYLKAPFFAVNDEPASLQV